MNRFWRFIVNKGEDGQENVELRIEGDIVDDDEAWLYEWFGMPSTSPNAFKEELNQYKDQDITVWIDSYGGSVFAAAGIYNALKEHQGKVTVKIDSKAMSAASVIAMAGDEILMSPVSIMMIHNPLTGVIGEAKDLRHAADVLDEVKESIINAYVTKTKRSRNKISQMMDEETWMSANVAVREGFADGILYQDDANQQTDPIQNFSFNRLAIVNSANKSILRAAELMKKADEDKPDIKDQSNVEEEKEKLLLELDLI
jgi:ATP-dependent Clp protease protease subunit